MSFAVFVKNVENSDRDLRKFCTKMQVPVIYFVTFAKNSRVEVKYLIDKLNSKSTAEAVLRLNLTIAFSKNNLNSKSTAEAVLRHSDYDVLILLVTGIPSLLRKRKLVNGQQSTVNRLWV